MTQIAGLVRVWFGVRAVALIVTIPGALAVLVRNPPLFAAFAVAAAIQLIQAVAWWKLRRGSPGARYWALAASLVTLPLPLPVLALAHAGSTVFPIIDGIVGSLGLIVFARGNPAATPAAPLPKRTGDGTGKLADVAAWVLGLGVLVGSSALWAWFAHVMLEHGIVLPRSAGWPRIAMLAAAVLIATAGHELGHVLAGWSYGMKLRAFRVGPVQGRIRNGRWAFGLHPGVFGGYVAMAQRDYSNRNAVAFLSAGGPLGSLATAAVSALAVFAAVLFYPLGGPLWALCAMTSSFALADFFVNMIPQRENGHYSDGAQFYQFMKGGEWAQLRMAFAMSGATLISSQRPRDMDPALLSRAAACEGATEAGLMLEVFQVLHYTDRGQAESAIEHLDAAERLFESVAFAKPAELCAEFAFYNALLKKDAARVEHWWTRLQTHPVTKRDTEFWLAQASIHWARGEAGNTQAALVEARSHAARLPQAGAYDYERSKAEWLAQMIASNADRHAVLATY